MLIKTKNNRAVHLRKLVSDDFDNLVYYFKGLSAATTKRFGPHPFDKKSIIDIYSATNTNLGYVAVCAETEEIIAYSILKTGCIEEDRKRLQTYGFALDFKTDCSFAPSVADAWQSCGVGNSLFHFIISDLKCLGIKRIILWGGVQADNCKALNYYKKHGFVIADQFYHNGENYDMTLEII